MLHIPPSAGTKAYVSHFGPLSCKKHHKTLILRITKSFLVNVINILNLPRKYINDGSFLKLSEAFFTNM